MAQHGSGTLKQLLKTKRRALEFWVTGGDLRHSGHDYKDISLEVPNRRGGREAESLRVINLPSHPSPSSLLLCNSPLICTVVVKHERFILITLLTHLVYCWYHSGTRAQGKFIFPCLFQLSFSPFPFLGYRTQANQITENFIHNKEVGRQDLVSLKVGRDQVSSLQLGIFIASCVSTLKLTHQKLTFFLAHLVSSQKSKAYELLLILGKQLWQWSFLFYPKPKKQL